jgi:hypothetical protein
MAVTPKWVTNAGQLVSHYDPSSIDSQSAPSAALRMWCRVAGHQASGMYAGDCAAKCGIINSSCKACRAAFATGLSTGMQRAAGDDEAAQVQPATATTRVPGSE